MSRNLIIIGVVGIAVIILIVVIVIFIVAKSDSSNNNSPKNSTSKNNELLKKLTKIAECGEFVWHTDRVVVTDNGVITTDRTTNTPPEHDPVFVILRKSLSDVPNIAVYTINQTVKWEVLSDQKVETYMIKSYLNDSEPSLYFQEKTILYMVDQALVGEHSFYEPNINAQVHNKITINENTLTIVTTTKIDNRQWVYTSIAGFTRFSPTCKSEGFCSTC